MTMSAILNFVPSLVEIGPVVLEKKKMWKVYNNDYEDYDDPLTTDNGQIVIRKAQSEEIHAFEDYDNNNDDRQRTNCDQESSLEFLALQSSKKLPVKPL